MLFLAFVPMAAGAPWEHWRRICFTKDMSTEWLVSHDSDGPVLLPPRQAVLYFLVPPTVTQTGRHWEIIFDSTGQKKSLLAEHFDSAQASEPLPRSFHGAPWNAMLWSLDPLSSNHRPCFWLVLASKAFWAGQRDPLNTDPRNTGSPTTYNLDPDDAMGIAFLEPTVTEQDGEWLLTTAANPTPQQLEHLAEDYDDWNRHHPGPPNHTIRKEVYPPKLQQEYDAWHAAWLQWRDSGGQGLSPRLEDYFLVTPEQQKQYAAWQKAKLEWTRNNGTTPYPQPIDYMQDDDTGPKSPVHP